MLIVVSEILYGSISFSVFSVSFFSPSIQFVDLFRSLLKFKTMAARPDLNIVTNANKPILNLFFKPIFVLFSFPLRIYLFRFDYLQDFMYGKHLYIHCHYTHTHNLRG